MNSVKTKLELKEKMNQFPSKKTLLIKETKKWEEKNIGFGVITITTNAYYEVSDSPGSGAAHAAIAFGAALLTFFTAGALAGPAAAAVGATAIAVANANSARDKIYQEKTWIISDDSGEILSASLYEALAERALLYLREEKFSQAASAFEQASIKYAEKNNGVMDLKMAELKIQAFLAELTSVHPSLPAASTNHSFPNKSQAVLQNIIYILKFLDTQSRGEKWADIIKNVATGLESFAYLAPNTGEQRETALTHAVEAVEKVVVFYQDSSNTSTELALQTKFKLARGQCIQLKIKLASAISQSKPTEAIQQFESVFRTVNEEPDMESSDRARFYKSIATGLVSITGKQSEIALTHAAEAAQKALGIYKKLSSEASNDQTRKSEIQATVKDLETIIHKNSAEKFQKNAQTLTDEASKLPNLKLKSEQLTKASEHNTLAVKEYARLETLYDSNKDRDRIKLAQKKVASFQEQLNLERARNEYAQAAQADAENSVAQLPEKPEASYQQWLDAVDLAETSQDIQQIVDCCLQFSTVAKKTELFDYCCTSAEKGLSAFERYKIEANQFSKIMELRKQLVELFEWSSIVIAEQKVMTGQIEKIMHFHSTLTAVIDKWLLYNSALKKAKLEEQIVYSKIVNLFLKATLYPVNKQLLEKAKNNCVEAESYLEKLSKCEKEKKSVENIKKYQSFINERKLFLCNLSIIFKKIETKKIIDIQLSSDLVSNLEDPFEKLYFFLLCNEYQMKSLVAVDLRQMQSTELLRQTLLEQWIPGCRQSVRAIQSYKAHHSEAAQDWLEDKREIWSGYYKKIIDICSIYKEVGKVQELRDQAAELGVNLPIDENDAIETPIMSHREQRDRLTHWSMQGGKP